MKRSLLDFLPMSVKKSKQEESLNEVLHSPDLHSGRFVVKDSAIHHLLLAERVKPTSLSKVHGHDEAKKNLLYFLSLLRTRQ
jgi:hypothetical protein